MRSGETAWNTAFPFVAMKQTFIRVDEQGGSSPCHQKEAGRFQLCGHRPPRIGIGECDVVSPYVADLLPSRALESGARCLRLKATA
jgi:hypothetical protein